MAPRLKCERHIENLSTAIYKTRTVGGMPRGVANAGACVCVARVCVKICYTLAMATVIGCALHLL